MSWISTCEHDGQKLANALPDLATVSGDFANMEHLLPEVETTESRSLRNGRALMPGTALLPLAFGGI